MTIPIVSLIVIILSSYYYYSRDETVKTCDMSDPVKRSFDAYFGIKYNYFQEVNGEQSSITLYKSFIPEDLFSKNSFICVGDRGTGKTMLRRKYLENKKILVEIFNSETSQILNNFLTNIRLNKELESKTDDELIKNHWKSEYFEHAILYMFTQKFLENYNKNKLEFLENLQEASVDEKIQLTLILHIFTSKERVNTLQEIVKEMWIENKKNLSEEDRKIWDQMNGKKVDANLLESFREIFKYLSEIMIISKDLNIIENITEIVREYDINPIFKIQYDKLSIFTQFYKNYFKVTPVISIDSLDEVKYFFDEKIIHKDALKTFVKSAFNPSILAKAFNGSIDLAYFFPKLEGIDPKDFMERRDKIPLIQINWTQSQLKNYSDYVLKVMQNEQRDACEKLKDFHSLVNYDLNKFYIDQLTTPREINIFMQEFMLSLSGDSEKYKFIPQIHNAALALEKTLGRINRANK